MRISDWSSDVCSSDLSKDGAFHRVMEFEPDQQPDPVLVGKAIHDMVAVLPCALEQITGDTGIQRSVTVTCKQVDSRLFFHAHSLRSVDWIHAGAGITRTSTRLNSSP